MVSGKAKQTSLSASKASKKPSKSTPGLGTKRSHHAHSHSHSQGSKSSKVPKRARESRKLPVTLLSGFLGAGKTSLLEHILKNNRNYKCAVIVNDMASLNIDAELIRKHNVLQTEEKIVQMQNGCICCTLREDLLVEVGRLAKEGKFDYLIIESTGISEPIQVAETFTFEYSQSKEDSVKATKGVKAFQSLSDVARLDTCATVIDALNFFSTFETADFLADRFEDALPEDDRTITDLMVDQIEFANVIILNKIDMLHAKVRAQKEKGRASALQSLAAKKNHKKRIAKAVRAEVNKIKAVIQKLNPKAKVIETSYSRVDLKQVIDTGLFSMEEAATSAGWLQSLQEELVNGGIPKPETEEYGVNSFVFKARRPFHPQRLYDLVNDKFCVIEESYRSEVLEEDGEEMDQSESEAEAEEEEEDEQEQEQEGDEEEEERQKEIKGRITNKLASKAFGPVLRSKGFIWLANRPVHYGEWSTAGCILNLTRGSPWFCILPVEAWPEDVETREAILRDFEEETGAKSPFGDRRQEIVFIGTGVQKGLIEAELNRCLLDDEEWERCQAWMRVVCDEGANPEDIPAYDIEDPWEEWPLEENEEEEEEHEETGLDEEE